MTSTSYASHIRMLYQSSVINNIIMARSIQREIKNINIAIGIIFDKYNPVKTRFLL